MIASGGVGSLEHLHQGLATGGADAVLAASIFHFGEHTVGDAKAYLHARGVVVRARLQHLWRSSMMPCQRRYASVLMAWCQRSSRMCTDGTVLMLAYMNEEALEMTRRTGYTHFWSRSRQALWKKGETSGNVQRVVAMSYDCDGDALLVQVQQHSVACHTGQRSCFYRDLPCRRRSLRPPRQDHTVPTPSCNTRCALSPHPHPS